MTTFLTEHERVNQQVGSADHVDLTFAVTNRGTITLHFCATSSMTGPRPAGPHFDITLGPQRLELFKIGTAPPKTNIQAETGIAEIFSVSAAEAALTGDWIARVTNISTVSDTVHVDVSFPGTSR
jgi:hypothetical protein